VSAVLARLLLDTLRLRGEGEDGDLPARWSTSAVAAGADAIAAWMRWERGEQWLLRRLADCGALPVTPPALVASLKRAAREDAKAGMAVDAEAAAALRVLSDLGVPCVLLKGPARRAAAASLLLADARLTRDVDLLVPEAAVERAWRAFVACGYTPNPQYDAASAPPGENEFWGPSPFHPRPLRRPGSPTVELHATTGPGLAPGEAWNRLTSTALGMQWQGLPVRVPAPTELLWHAVTHADVGESFGWSLRYWLDAASVLAAQRVEWHTIDARLGSRELPSRARALRWLDVAGRLAGAPVPAHLAPTKPFPMQRVIEWRLGALARRTRRVQWTEKLIDEATRIEAGLGFAPLVGARSWPIHLRRRTASLLARGGYYTWRALRR
jgi:hypothetical protein